LFGLEGLTIVTEPEKVAVVGELLRTSYADTVERRTCEAPAGPDDICVRIAPAQAQAIEQAALATAIATIRARLVAAKVPNTVTAKAGQIVVTLPAGDDERIHRIRSLIARTGRLDFKLADGRAEYAQRLARHVEGDARAKDLDILVVTDESGPYVVGHDRQVIDTYLRELAISDPSFRVPDDRQIGYERVIPEAEAKDQRPYVRTYYLDRTTRLQGSMIADARGKTDESSGRPVIVLDFNKAGAEALREVTAANVGKKLATVLDGTIASAAIITGEISRGRAEITMGGGTDQRRQEEDRDELVRVLRTGALPGPLREESIVELP
jgi:preprotein translocase subunit SecD